MTKYYYVVSENKHNYSRDELYHFDLSKIKIPELNLPKINIPEINIPEIKLPKIETPKIDFSKIKLPNIKISDITNTVNLTHPKLKSGNSTDRQWENHKWIDRKRDENGKWIYDYGDGFPGENNSISGDTTYKIDPDNDIKLADVSPIAKILGPLAGLGDVVLGPSLEAKINGGKRFLGSIEEGLNNIKLSALKFGTKTDPESGLSVKHKDYGKDFDLKTVNPGFNNPDGGSQSNCPCCSVAYDMRRRGYEVKAKESMLGMTNGQLVSFYKDPVVHHVTADDTNESGSSYELNDKGGIKNTKLTKAVNKQLSTEPEGSRGVAWVEWNYQAGGHIVAYEIENGSAKLYDAQTGQKLDVNEYVDRACDFKYYRTDNLEPNYEQVRKVVE